MPERESDLMPTDLLDQAEIWVDRYGKVHQLDTMNIHHRASLIPFLRRQARVLQDYAWLRYVAGLGAVEDPSDGVWHAQLSVESELELPPEEWLDRTLLMRRLVELDQRSTAQRAVTRLRNRTYPIRKRLGLT